jgi:sugar phosphate isomerase/epimerase
MAYRRCISTLGCPDFSLDEALALAARHRLDAVEIRALAGTVDVPAVLSAAYGEPARLSARMRTAAVPIVSLDASLKLADNNPTDRAAFLQLLPWAEACGVPWLRVFDGGKQTDAATHRAMADTVEWWRDERRKHGWHADIMIETHDALFTARSIHDFLALAPGTAILWDAQHTWRNGGEEPLTTWHAIKAHVVHVHVKDSVSRPSARHPFSYVLPGEGEFAMPPLRAALAAEFTGCVSLEWEKLWHPYLAPLDDALAAAEKCNWW